MSVARRPSLLEVRPDLAEEWHQERNAPLTPGEVTCGLDRKAWWICPRGHDYEAAIGHRTLNGSGCPYCANHRVLLGFNDLATTHPELAREWHPTRNGDLTPQRVIAGSNKKRWWRCSAGHEWEALSSHRAGPRRIGCPYCSGLRTQPGATDLASTHPRLAAEWHPVRNVHISPTDVPAGSERVIWWLCPAGHEYRASPSARSQRGRDPGCPVCAGRVVLSGYNDLASSHPELAADWHPTLNDPIRAQAVLRNSSMKAWWLCQEGHSWQQTVASRAGRGTGCPVCSNRRVLAGCNDLATTHPRIAAQWHPKRNGSITPTALTAGSAERIWWRCDHGHEWEAVCYSRTTGKARGCPICSNKRVLAGYNDLATTHPELAAEWHPERNGEVRPDQLVAGSSQRAWWQCSSGHEWQSIVNSRRDGNRNCPFCSGTRVLTGFNDLATTHPTLAVQWHPDRNGGLTPELCAPGSGAAIWWRCDLGHEWRTTPASRTGPAASGCPYCTNKAVLPGYNDLATTHPELAKQWHPTRNGALTPRDIAAGSRRTIWWMCDRGHEWPAMGSNRARLAVGCPDCAPGGFRPNSRGSVYVVTNGAAHKIGIMGADRKRLYVHRSTGWHLAKVWDFAIGRDAYAVEQEVVRHLRTELNLVPAYLTEEMRQGGATETVAANDLPLSAFCSLVNDTVARLGLVPIAYRWEQGPLPL